VAFPIACLVAACSSPSHPVPLRACADGEMSAGNMAPRRCACVAPMTESCEGGSCACGLDSLAEQRGEARGRCETRDGVFYGDGNGEFTCLDRNALPTADIAAAEGMIPPPCTSPASPTVSLERPRCPG